MKWDRQGFAPCIWSGSRLFLGDSNSDCHFKQKPENHASTYSATTPIHGLPHSTYYGDHVGTQPFGETGLQR